MTSPGDRGPDGTPEDPFDRPPNETGQPRDPWGAQPHPADQTAPIQPGAYPGAYPGAVPGGQPGATAPPPPAQPGYWEQQAAQGQTSYGQTPYGQAGQPGYQQPGYQPAYPQPAYGGYGQPGYGYGYALAPTHPSATTSLVLGLVGLIGGVVACGLPLLVAPFAIFVGRKTMREIDASNGQLGGRSNAKAGFVMGIIGTVLLVLALVAVALLVVLGIASSSSGGYTEY